MMKRVAIGFGENESRLAFRITRQGSRKEGIVADLALSGSLPNELPC
jgi:hypothetical protein